MVKIFVGRLTEEVKKTELEELFKAFGEVTDCSVLKNYGFVHMANLDEANAAIAGLDKHELHGNQINVELSTTKVAKASKLFVGNLPPDTKSSEVHKLFKKYGTVIECDVVKNFAFVHMGKESMAREAIDALNDTEFNGNKISVQMSRAKRQDEGHFDGPRPPFMFPGADPWGLRGRGRGFFGMPPMRGIPRFRGRPFVPDPFMDPSLGRGALRPRIPVLADRTAALGAAMYDRDLLARGIARRDMILGAGDPFILREREALARRLDAESSLESYATSLNVTDTTATTTYGYQAASLTPGLDGSAYGAAATRFGLDRYSAY